MKRREQRAFTVVNTCTSDIVKAEVNNIYQDLHRETKQIQTIQEELNETIHKMESQGEY